MYVCMYVMYVCMYVCMSLYHTTVNKKKLMRSSCKSFLFADDFYILFLTKEKHWLCCYTILKIYLFIHIALNHHSHLTYMYVYMKAYISNNCQRILDIVSIVTISQMHVGKVIPPVHVPIKARSPSPFFSSSRESAAEMVSLACLYLKSICFCHFFSLPAKTLHLRSDLIWYEFSTHHFSIVRARSNCKASY